MTWCATFKGRKFDYEKLSQKNIVIEDIAHALSLICRFNGHCEKFYSVAEHSYWLAKYFYENCDYDDEHRLSLARHALFHDAPEAYVGDIIRPLKTSEMKKLEQRIYMAIAKKFDLSSTIPLVVQNADTRLLMAEARLLNPSWYSRLNEWDTRHFAPLNISLKLWKPATAEKKFLRLYNELQG